MGNLINRKRVKAFSVLRDLGDKAGGESFAELFRERYPDDWARIELRFEEEERSTPSGRRHPMPDPDRYMRAMYRHFSKRWRAERG